MSWGKILLVAYVTFVGVMLFMVVKSFQQDYDLVTPDYYAAELKFQDQIDASKNAAIYKDSIVIEPTDAAVNLQFPTAFRTSTSGQVYFYKASDSDRDVIQPLELDGSGKQQFNRTTFDKGFYTIKISWTKDNVQYYTEKELYL